MVKDPGRVPADESEDDTLLRVDVVYPSVSVGIRDLRHDTAALLKRVEEGEAIMVTNRGRAVAVMRPLNEEERRQEDLVARGVILMPEDGGPGTGKHLVEVMKSLKRTGRMRTSEEIDSALDYVRADRELL
jgi:prevent-host-death family protein